MNKKQTTTVLEVIPTGTLVKIVADKLMSAVVTGICIKSDCFVTYELSWFYDGTSKSAWFQRFEFTIESQLVKKQIGFKNT
jgi:hypothetical protein